jgi:hypothetical protein
METIKTILQQMSKISTPQQKFILKLLSLIMCLRGRANFRNFSRYSDYHEKTFSRWYRRSFNFIEFNSLLLSHINTGRLSEMIAALDCSFIRKSGKLTEGLGQFFNGISGRAEKGLEISTLAVVDMEGNTSYNLSTQQILGEKHDDENRIDQYLAHLQQALYALPKLIRYLATDGYYAKKKFIDGAVKLGLEQIGKLRHDAALRWLYEGEQKPRGRKRLYDGKVNFNDLSRFEFVGALADGTKQYTAVVNSACFKRNLRIVYLVKQVGDKVQTALLFSTDVKLCPKTLVRYYKARFQIEFLFRDAKQFLGLNDCQARCHESLQFHFNATMTTLNLLKWENQQRSESTKSESTKLGRVISIASWKIRKSNEHLLERFSSYLGLDFSSIKSRPDFRTFCNYGAIAT